MEHTGPDQNALLLGERSREQIIFWGSKNIVGCVMRPYEGKDLLAEVRI